jgi:4-amino-4-deoxy-L-arabinose transferase-like glycosyltransferase
MWLALWTAVGLGIRLASVLVRVHQTAGGDSYYYWHAANLLVAGKGFINPFDYFPHNLHHAVPTAQWPPFFVVVLAIPAALGFHGFLADRIWCCIIGAAAVVACGYTGREIGGRRVGLVAALLVAVYPNLWMSDELGLSETLSPLLVALILLAAYRFWKRPGIWTVVALGASIGIAALARDELSLLGLFLFVPLVLLAKSVSWGRRAALLGLGALTAIVLVGPWIGYNMSRFKDPVFISSGFGVTLESANCNAVYSGQFEGYWNFSCRVAAAAATARIDRGTDESVQGTHAQTYALHYIEHHKNRIVPVVAARIGRAFGFFHPFQQIDLDATVETRPHSWALAGLWMYYGLFALSIGGVVVLRRRRVPVFPLLAVGLDVVISVVVTFGNTRYRTPFEVSLVLLAAVQIEWIWSRLFGPGDDGWDGQVTGVGAADRVGGGDPSVHGVVLLPPGGDPTASGSPDGGAGGPDAGPDGGPGSGPAAPGGGPAEVEQPAPIG